MTSTSQHMDSSLRVEVYPPTSGRDSNSDEGRERSGSGSLGPGDIGEDSRVEESPNASSSMPSNGKGYGSVKKRSKEDEGDERKPKKTRQTREFIHSGLMAVADGRIM